MEQNLCAIWYVILHYPLYVFFFSLILFPFRGFGFVRFFDEDQFKQALNEMNGVKGLGKRPIKVNVALKR